MNTRLPPLTLAEFDAQARMATRHPAVRLLHRIGSALGDQAASIAVSTAGVLYRLLYKPLAFLVVCCWLIGAVFLANDRWLDAWVCAVFSIVAIAILAGLRWVAGLYQWYGEEG